MAPDDESQDVEGPDPVAAPAPDPAPPPLNPRQVRARRRRRRRQIGTLIFLVVAAGILATAYFAVSGSNDAKDAATGTGDAASTTTTVKPPFVGKYAVTTGLNVREGPGTTFKTVANIEQGHDVAVMCVAEGEPVNASSGPSTKWLRVAGLWASGYVSAAYVRVGDDLASNKIPACATS